jgi:hypothetical protein
MSNLVYIDAKGDKQAMDLSVSMYRDAAEKGMSLKQHMAGIYPTNAEKHGSAYEQALEQTGVFVRGNKELGLRPSTIEDVLSPKEANAVTREGVPVSRLLFPAVMLDVIENKLTVDYATNPNALNSMVAVDDSIQGDRWERPVINFSAPEAARGTAVAQLALPNTMLTITSSDKSMRIPTWGIGMEISEQAQRATTLDLVGLAVARQAQVETNERTNAYILSLLNGDVDVAMAALSTFAGKVQTAVSLDAAATTNLTQRSWMTWLTQRTNKRMITHIVTDINGAMAIENRVGKPIVTNDNPTSNRIDTLFEVINPNWPSQVKIFLTNDPLWPAKTIMGIDGRYGIHRVSSLTAQYSAIEQFAMRRSTMLRIDKGEMVYRLFDEAFEVLTYA